MIINSLILTSVKWLWMRKLVKLKMAWSSNWIRRMKTLQTVKTNQLTKKCNLWLNQERENAEKSISARTQIDSTMPRICATTATTARARPSLPLIANIPINPITPMANVKIAILLSITSRGRRTSLSEPNELRRLMMIIIRSTMMINYHNLLMILPRMTSNLI